MLSLFASDFQCKATSHQLGAAVCVHFIALETLPKQYVVTVLRSKHFGPGDHS